MLNINQGHNREIMGKCQAYKDGFSDGFSGGFNEAIITFIHNLPYTDTKESIITQLMRCFNISESAASALVNEHWK